MTIAVLDYGSGNLRSVSHALERVGADVEVTGVHERVMRAAGLVVPGVGHFGACMAALRERSLDATIEAFIATGKSVFGVCVGMQVLFEGSDEAAGVPGLGVFDGTVARLREDRRVPHMGWNDVTWTAGAYLEPDPPRWFYFAHSYAAPTTERTVATAEYGETFSAAVRSANVFATQFHPERSGAGGLRLYDAFVRDTVVLT